MNLASVNTQEILLLMSGGLFILGLCTFFMGILLLISRVFNRDMRTLTTQTMRLAQKGFTEDLSGLVGNTSALLHSLNGLIQTTKGIGTFLSLLGFFIMVMAMILLIALDQNLLQYFVS